MKHDAKLSKLAAPAEYSLGPGTYRVSAALHTANRASLTALLLAALGNREPGVILLQGGEQHERFDTDNEPLFRQESYFHYLFGVREAGCYGAISLPDGCATLFVPKLGRDYEVICGAFPKPAQFEEMCARKKLLRARRSSRRTPHPFAAPPLPFARRYGVDEALHVEQMVPWLQQRLEASAGARVHVLSGVNSDSGASFPPPALPDHPAASAVLGRYEGGQLYACAADARSRKGPLEVELMRYTYALSSAAHVSAMRLAAPGVMEYQLEAHFLHHCYARGGARQPAYTCICASGPNAAVLHYGHAGRPNARQLQAGEMVLLDMGCEYGCYASDITNSFPASGTFSADQRLVYEAVLAAQTAVVRAMRPGVPWTEMHRLAERTMLAGLQQGGLLVGDVEEMVESGLGAVFMPHGLGHLIGVDTHDVGGYLPSRGHPARSERPGLRRLRTARALEAGMVITVEPGIYFIDALLDEALADPQTARFLDAEQLQRFRGFGGVRIEDGVLVTADGAESLAACPRSVDEVEAVMAGGAWPPAVDRVPELGRTWHELAPDCASMVAAGPGAERG